MAVADAQFKKLEERVEALEGAMKLAGAFVVDAMKAALDQMVDERLLPAKTRTEIWGRIRKEISPIGLGSKELAAGARGAIPRYATEEDKAVMKEVTRQVKETLRPRYPRTRGGTSLSPDDIDP